MRLRLFQPGDEQALSALYRASVQTLGPLGYQADQVAQWAALAPAPEAFLEAALAPGVFFVLAETGAQKVIGFLAWHEGGHIQFLYVHPEASRRGVGQALYEYCEPKIRKSAPLIAEEVTPHGSDPQAKDHLLSSEHCAPCNQRRLFTEASEIAKPFFLKQGFRIVKRRDFKISNVPIHNYAMEKIVS